LIADSSAQLNIMPVQLAINLKPDGDTRPGENDFFWRGTLCDQRKGKGSRRHFSLIGDRPTMRHLSAASFVLCPLPSQARLHGSSPFRRVNGILIKLIPTARTLHCITAHHPIAKKPLQSHFWAYPIHEFLNFIIIIFY